MSSEPRDASKSDGADVFERLARLDAFARAMRATHGVTTSDPLKDGSWAPRKVVGRRKPREDAPDGPADRA